MNIYGMLDNTNITVYTGLVKNNLYLYIIHKPYTALQKMTSSNVGRYKENMQMYTPSITRDTHYV